MKKAYLITAILLLSSVWVVAQSSSPQSTTPDTSSSQSQSSQPSSTTSSPLEHQPEQHDAAEQLAFEHLSIEPDSIEPDSVHPARRLTLRHRPPQLRPRRQQAHLTALEIPSRVALLDRPATTLL